MKTNIIIHVMPTEIDWFERISESLLRNSVYLTDVECKNITIDVTLNLSKDLYEYSEFKIPVEFFVMRFNFIEEKLKQSFSTNFNIECSGAIKGINDKRRDSIRKYSDLFDIFIYIDNDMIFPDITLTYLINSAHTLLSDNKEYFIITPEITKFWDNSWDIITNKNYLSYPFNHRDTFNTFNLYNTINTEDIYLEENKFDCKIAGGWLNVFSSKLLKFVDIPDSLGSYGEDDTYVMKSFDIMKSFQFDVKHYIIRNLIVSEEGKFRKKIYDMFIPKIKDPQEIRTRATNNLHIELHKFNKKCHDYILHSK